MFRPETDIVMTLARTAMNGPEDAKAVQAGMRLRPLNSFTHKAAPPQAASIKFST